MQEEGGSGTGEYEIAEEKLGQATKLLTQADIDAWLLLSREGTDLNFPLLAGQSSIHHAALLVTRTGEHILLSSKSDEASYAQCTAYQVQVYDTSLGNSLRSVLDDVKPRTLALNISETDALYDGLTLGQYRWLEGLMGEEWLRGVQVTAEPLLRSLRGGDRLSVTAEHNFTVAREKIAQAKRELAHHQVDAWMILTSDIPDPCISLIPGVGTVGLGVFVITTDGCVAMCTPIDAQQIEESGVFDEVVTYDGDAGNALRGMVTRLGISWNRLAVNYSESDNLCDGLTVGRYQFLIRNLDGVFHGEVVSSEPFLQRIRATKSETELALIDRAIAITHDIYDEVFAALRPGMTEREVGQLFVDGMAKRGVVNAIDHALSMPIVMKERFAHRDPSDVVIEPGDLLIMDFSVDYQGYASDVARTVYFLREGEQEPPANIQFVFQSIHDAISLAFSAIRPGVKGYEVDAVARNHLQSRGLPDITHSTGHQIGQSVHDGGTLLGPKWPRYGSAPYGELFPGMVLTLEPTVFLDERIGFIVEENVVVTDGGARYLTNRQEELILIPAPRGGLS